MRVTVKELDEYRIEPTKFVVIDLHARSIAKTFPFPKELDQGFGPLVSFKVSPDGKLSLRLWKRCAHLRPRDIHSGG